MSRKKMKCRFRKTIERWHTEDEESSRRLGQLFAESENTISMVADIVGCSDADHDLVTAIEQCAAAEAKCQAGEITLQQLYEVYVRLIPAFDACDNFDPWSKLVSRANRIARMTGNHVICELY